MRWFTIYDEDGRNILIIIYQITDVQVGTHFNPNVILQHKVVDFTLIQKKSS